MDQLRDFLFIHKSKLYKVEQYVSTIRENVQNKVLHHSKVFLMEIIKASYGQSVFILIFMTMHVIFSF